MPSGVRTGARSGRVRGGASFSHPRKLGSDIALGGARSAAKGACGARNALVSMFTLMYSERPATSADACSHGWGKPECQAVLQGGA